ncbi:2Fe-2S iron-sulfur cluster-binding protein [Streptomyces triticiradicis]|uniref:(2Fe-2S)-binding protein n=1 Tax=Streptomyces triticiradicis TaxID=2651189 RepID=A0A7J5DE73_9ACTN|nr:(2Fe-2S)-binding protein [Streptomyces triticiradicis]KAB1986833.1 (2Fe-2S)-binding protein [Streptomyces triticiradicis]
MTDDQHEEGAARSGSRWDPLPQGDYDDGATAFVQLPEGGIEALLAAREPLAAPGHGYVPPQIAVAPAPPEAADPAAGGTWAGQGGNAPWPDPETAQPGAGAHDDRFAYNPGSTGQWQFDDGTGHGQAQGPGHDVTGQWSIPVAGGDLPDESGEFTTSALVEQWGGTPPATLPGGAAAPWAGEIGQAWTADARETAAEAPAGQSGQPEAGSVPQAAQEPVQPAREAPEPAAAPEPVLTEAHEASEPDPAHEAAVTDDGTPDADLLAPAGHDDHPLASYVLRVNGADRPVTDAWVGESLLYVLRERLGLAGAKDGCSQGECGACNVQVDGRLVASCLVPGVTAAGSEVRTVEGLATDGQPSDVQRALARCGAVQCGFCVPGMAMTLHDLLEGNPAPTELETRQALCGNLCRCSGYRGVLDAVREVVAERETHAAAEAEAAPAADEARIPHQAGPGAGGVHPSAYDDGAAYGSPAQHDQPYGQDGGQA